ncbi:hypothetical protein WJ05_28785 [Burkholderia vietnamiensis]|nr:hypothetical protein WJ05_28785 [Burkholderia vietnamiensis]
MDEMQEPPFTTVKLEDFVPADHPLRPLRLLVNQAPKRLNGVFVLFVQILAVSRRNPLSRKAPRPCDIFSKHDLQTVDQKGISDPKRQNLHERYEYPDEQMPQCDERATQAASGQAPKSDPRRIGEPAHTDFFSALWHGVFGLRP